MRYLGVARPRAPRARATAQGGLAGHGKLWPITFPGVLRLLRDPHHAASKPGAPLFIPLNYVLPIRSSCCCPHTAERALSSCLSFCWGLVCRGGRRTLQPILHYTNLE